MAAFAALTLYGSPGHSQWRYRVGEQLQQQQANFCASLDDVAELAALFRRFGARTGFSALSAAPGCFVAEGTFTPLSVENEVIIKLESGDQYAVRFVKVRMENSDIRYLVTTRGVDPAK